MEVKIIKTQAEHDDAMARLKALMALDRRRIRQKRTSWNCLRW